MAGRTEVYSRRASHETLLITIDFETTPAPSSANRSQPSAYARCSRFLTKGVG